MTERHNDTSRTTPVPEIHALSGCEMTGDSTVINEQYFIEAAKRGEAVSDVDLARWYIK